MYLQFQNKIVLITYGSQKIGFETAKDFSNQEALALSCDVSKETNVKTTIKQIIQQFSKLDIAFNNSGIQSTNTNIADLTIS